jgi:hypothetical protein
MVHGFHNFVTRKTKTRHVLAMLLIVAWGTLPSTACVCADGTFKVFCSGICSGSKCCCSIPQRSCNGCACHSGACTSIADSKDCVEPGVDRQLSKPCGCHRVAKDQATLVVDDRSNSDDLPIFDLGQTSTPWFSTTMLNRLPSAFENRERPPDDIVILFRHLII